MAGTDPEVAPVPVPPVALPVPVVPRPEGLPVREALPLPAPEPFWPELTVPVALPALPVPPFAEPPLWLAEPEAALPLEPLSELSGFAHPGRAGAKNTRADTATLRSECIAKCPYVALASVRALVSRWRP